MPPETKKRKRKDASANGGGHAHKRTPEHLQEPLLEPFHLAKVTALVSVLPSSIGKLMDAIQTSLNSTLLRWQDSVQGVPLTYSKLRFPKNRQYGQLIDEMPHIHFQAKVQVLLFRPSPGLKLEGTVTSVTATHVSLQVYQLFSADIAAEELYERGFSYQDDGQEWISNTLNHAAPSVLKIGEIISFVVRGIRHSSGIISMDASLPSYD